MPQALGVREPLISLPITSPACGPHNAPAQLVDRRSAGALPPPQRASHASLSPDDRIGGAYRSTLLDTSARTAPGSVPTKWISLPSAEMIVTYVWMSPVARSVRVSVPLQSASTV